MTSAPPPAPRHSLARDLLATLWQQPLWAIPFALFFLALGVAPPREYPRVYAASLVYAYCIRLALVAVRHAVLPRIRGDATARDTRGVAAWTDGVWFTGAAVLASYVAAFILDRTFLPGFLGSPRALLQSGLFALLFAALFTGIVYAMVFHRQALERAAAAEQARAELARAELRALRAQLEPHFLFNALNTIAALIVENPAAAEDTVTRLADVLRHALLASGSEHVPLREELAFAHSVLDIERVRFGERLTVRERVDPALLDVPVPSLILQPVVENAVRHGIAARPGGGTIELSARREGDSIVLEVKDDGAGFEPDQAPRGGGFGLHAVRERLRIAGPPHALEVTSAPGRGTDVRITLPVAPDLAPAAPARAPAVREACP
ncbi:MAG TPA: histidine kinase [Candidatus Eisenbacteria bacterium]|nr:histidine kinase [Candidatus Eisenbacteria bacterium]